jgi:hypothetical protein
VGANDFQISPTVQYHHRKFGYWQSYRDPHDHRPLHLAAALAAWVALDHATIGPPVMPLVDDPFVNFVDVGEPYCHEPIGQRLRLNLRCCHRRHPHFVDCYYGVHSLHHPQVPDDCDRRRLVLPSSERFPLLVNLPDVPYIPVNFLVCYKKAKQ